MEETKIIYHMDDEETPYLVKLNISPERVTLADFKNVLNRPNYKYFFKSMDDDFGVVKEEIIDDDAHLPCFNGRVVSWLVSAEGSNVSDGASQCTDSMAHSEAKHDRADHMTSGHGNRGTAPLSHDDTLTETESIISSRQGHHLHKSLRHHSEKYEKYNKYNGLRINGHSKHRSGHGYETASILSSDLETTTFLESDDDASSRITSTTGRHTNMSSTVDKGTLDRRRPQRRRRHRLPPMSRTSSFSSITDSTMSLNIITVSLNMDTVNFLGISIVGQSNKGGDGGIYVGSIMKGGAVALDGRIEPGDMILQVNDINFENMSNDEAVRVLREVVQKPGNRPTGEITLKKTYPSTINTSWVMWKLSKFESSKENFNDDLAKDTIPEYFLYRDSPEAQLPARSAAVEPRTVVEKSPIKLVVAKCWDPNPKGYFTIPRTEPVRPIDPGAWVAHTAAIRGEGFPPRPPSATTLTSTSSSLASTLPDTERPLEELHLTVNTDMPTVVRAMARSDSGLEIRDRMWLKITIPNAFIGADVVDWLNTHVEGFIDRRDARKYASLMLKAGFIRHTVNKITFSEQCYYIFGDLCSAISSMKLDCDTVGPLPPPNAWDMPYSGTYAPHSATGYSPMPFNFTNEPTVYGYHREESVHSGSGGSSAGSERICKEPIHDLKSCSSASESELHNPSMPSMPSKNSGNGNGSNGKRSNGSRSRSSGSEQSVQTGTGSGNQQNQQDLSGRRLHEETHTQTSDLDNNSRDDIYEEDILEYQFLHK